MTRLYCTKTLWERLGTAREATGTMPTATTPTRLGDWWATYLPVRPKHLVLALSTNARLPIVLPAAPLATLPARFEDARRQRLESLALAPEAIERELSAGGLTLARSTHTLPEARSLLATLRQFVEYTGYDLYDGHDPVTIALRLERIPLGPLGMSTARKAARELLDPATVAREAGHVHRLRVTLRDSDPPIWRRFLAPSGFTLAQLHRTIQALFAWEDCHLHRFEVGGRSYGEPWMWDEADESMGWERGQTLLQVAPSAGDTLVYEYDMGDFWEHDLVVESIEAVEEELRRPVCLSGEGAAPPEDCGGIWHYQQQIVPALMHPEREAEDFDLDEDLVEVWREHFGADFDASAFDQAAVQARLDRMWISAL